MNRRWRTFLWVALGVLAFQVVGAMAQTAKQAPRAKLPKFDSGSKVFFDDVFAVLVGERPTSLATKPAPPAGGSPAAPKASGSGFAWSKVISATTLEDEIKAIKLSVDKDVTNPGAFKGRGYKECRRHFSMAATLFAIIGEYDADVRWKDKAPIVRELFARTASNAKVGTTQVYNEAKLRKQDLQDMVGGGSVSGKDADRAASWDRVADRGPLMQRLEVSQMEHLQKMTSSEGNFKQNRDRIMHEAELVAALGEVLVKAGMEDGDDEDYAAFAIRMKDAAREIVDGVKLNNYEQVRKAVGNIDKACSECHENYRG